MMKKFILTAALYLGMSAAFATPTNEMVQQYQDRMEVYVKKHMTAEQIAAALRKDFNANFVARNDASNKIDEVLLEESDGARITFMIVIGVIATH
jgi:hypothetical protein